jgi:cyclopropane fatty-acyl-phospholipid synthase-like methyltransferase
VLDVGCGQGALTRRLRALGYEAVGVDPEAPEEPGFERVPLEELRCDRQFDAAVAMRSFHHIGRLDRAVAVLASCLPAEARLVVFEFAVEGVDERSERWLRERELPPPIAPEHRDEILTFAEVDAALTSAFTRISRAPAPYLAREAGRPDLEADEEEAIAAGALPAAGMRAVYELRPSA